MAILSTGICGGFRNKVDGVVGFVHRGTKVIRAYAVPSNPRSTSQTNQRNAFKLCTTMGRWMYNAVILTFWNVIQSGQKAPGFSKFVQSQYFANKHLSLDSTKSSILLTDGRLYEGQLDDAITDATTKYTYTPPDGIFDDEVTAEAWIQDDADTPPRLLGTVVLQSTDAQDLFTGASYTAMKAAYSSSIMFRKSTVVSAKDDYSATYCCVASELVKNTVMNTAKI